MTTTQFPTMDQIESIFGSHARAQIALKALKAAGAPITVDTCHAVMVMGTGVAAECARPGYAYQGGSRALGLI